MNNYPHSIGKWWIPHWPKILISLVVLNGIIFLSAYKIFISEADPWYAGLIIFTELIAGILTIPQVVLRGISPHVANRMLLGSFLVRVLLAGIGMQIFFEASQAVWSENSIWPVLTIDRIKYSQLIAYQAANFLMWVAEYMFGYLIASKDIDLGKELISAKEEIKVQKLSLNNQSNQISELRQKNVQSSKNVQELLSRIKKIEHSLRQKITQLELDYDIKAKEIVGESASLPTKLIGLTEIILSDHKLSSEKLNRVKKENERLSEDLEKALLNVGELEKEINDREKRLHQLLNGDGEMRDSVEKFEMLMEKIQVSSKDAARKGMAYWEKKLQDLNLSENGRFQATAKYLAYEYAFKRYLQKEKEIVKSPQPQNMMS